MRIPTAIVVVAVLAIFAVACEDSGGDAPLDPTPAVSPTVGEASTPVPGSESSRTPAARQLASDAGRDDCPADWLAFQTLVFSVCYPPDLQAEVLSSPAFPTVLQIRLIPGDAVSAAPYTVAVWGASGATTPDVAACNFEGQESAELDQKIVDDTDLGLLTATTCTARLLTQTQYYGVATTDRATIAFKSQAGSDEQLALAKQILATLRGETLMIRAIVFDFYETLVQLTTAQREALFDTVALEVGLDLPPGEAYHHWAVYTTRDADLRLGGTERTAFDGEYPPFVLFGDVWKHRSAELLRHWSSDAHEHLVADAYVRAHATAPLYPDVRPAIESLRGTYELAVLSDADTGFIVGALAHNGLSFDTIVTSEDLRTYKPHVSMFREVCARLGVEPGEAAYVGDSPWHDIAGARNAGMQAIWLNRHARDWPADIEPPETTITSLGDLRDIVASPTFA